MKNRLSLVTAFVLGTVLSSWLWSPPLQAQTVEHPCAAPAPESQPSAGLPPQDATPAPADNPVESREPAAPESPLLRLSELLPDPEGNDEAGEFIEIENVGGDADAGGWSLGSSSGKTFALSVNIAARGRYAFAYAETRLTLPNAGATITLRDPTGAVMDAVTYPGPAKTGRSYARDDSGAWRWTSVVTQGMENAFDAEAAPVTSPEPIVTPTVPDDVKDQPAPLQAENEPAPIAVATASASLRISEFLPNPSGDDGDEWIELQNIGDDDIDLDGLFLDDAEGGSAAFDLAAIRIVANGHAVIPKSMSAIALNNTGDDVRVTNAAGDVFAAVRYALAPEGKSHAFFDGAWAWTDAPTPGYPNIPPIATVAESAPVITEHAAEMATAEPAEEASVSDVSGTDDGVLVTVSGTVTLAPGAIGKRTFAIQDGDASLLVRAYGNATMPTMAAGDVVRVTGRKRDGLPFSTTGRMIARIAAGEVAFADKTLEELGADDAGLAVRLRGIVTRRMSRGFIIADADFDAETTVRTGQRPPADEVLPGAEVTVRGVVRLRAEKIELVAATVEGVKAPPPAENAAPPAAVPKSERATFVAPTPEPRTAVPVAAGAAGSSVAAAALIALLRRRKDGAAAALPADG